MENAKRLESSFKETVEKGIRRATVALEDVIERRRQELESVVRECLDEIRAAAAMAHDLPESMADLMVASEGRLFTRKVILPKDLHYMSVQGAGALNFLTVDHRDLALPRDEKVIIVLAVVPVRKQGV